MDKILAMVTTYNPDAELLKRNLSAVIPQVDKVLVFENASKNRDEIVSLCNKLKVEVILNPSNLGVAGPLYDGIEYAVNNGYEYILTLDQDSVMGAGSVKVLYDKIITDDSIAMVGSDLGEQGTAKTVYEIITSGTLSRAKHVKAAGNYDRELFIDGVDWEMCFRLKRCGYKIVVAKGAYMLHNFGELTELKFLWRRFLSLNYSPVRLYYQHRNIYFIKKWYPEQKKAVKVCERFFRINKLKIILAEKDKRIKLNSIKQGRRDGKKMVKERKELLKNK